MDNEIPVQSAGKADSGAVAGIVAARVRSAGNTNS
jgi:hypothetical protein